jgi:hypothetical protein
MDEKKSFKDSFLILSLMFFTYFYLVPGLTIFFSGNDVYYQDKLLNNKFDILKFITCGALFLFGLFLSMRIRLSKTKFTDSLIANERIHYVFWVIFVLFVIYQLGLLFDESRAERLYAIRAGEAIGSHTEFFLSIIIAAIQFTVLFHLTNLKKRKIAIGLVLLSVLVAINSSVGRTNLLLSFLILFLLLTNIKSNKLSILVFLSVSIFTPILLVLKTLIYQVSVSGTFSIDELMNSTIDIGLYFDSFGHVIASFVYVEDLINLMGYRYFYDFIQGPLFYLKIIGVDVDNSITYYNTKVLLGVNKSIIPPGYLAMGFLQLSYVGVFFAGVFYGGLGRLVEYIYLSFGYKNEVTKFTLAFLAANTFYHGDLRVMILSFFIPVLFYYFTKNIFISKGSF